MSIQILDIIFAIWGAIILLWLFYDILSSKNLRIKERVSAWFSEKCKTLWHHLGD